MILRESMVNSLTISFNFLGGLFERAGRNHRNNNFFKPNIYSINNFSKQFNIIIYLNLEGLKDVGISYPTVSLIRLTLMKICMTNLSTDINYAYIQFSFKRPDMNNSAIIGTSVFFTTNNSLLPKRTQPLCILQFTPPDFNLLLASSKCS